MDAAACLDFTMDTTAACRLPPSDAPGAVSGYDARHRDSGCRGTVPPDRATAQAIDGRTVRDRGFATPEGEAEMQEIIPVVLGVLLAFATRSIVPSRTRLMVLVAASLVLGFLVSALVGELALSWGFIWVDALFVLAAAAVTIAVMTAVSRRSTVSGG